MFKRKKTKTTFKRIKDFIYPDMGLYRSLQYNANRVKRIKARPYSIAAGIACGVAMSFTPFLGLHFLLSALFALIIRGSLFASAIGTLAGNPLTFPFIFLLIYQTGNFLLGTESNMDVDIIKTTLNALVSLIKLCVRFILDYQSAIDNWHIYKPILIDLGRIISPMLLGGLIWGAVAWFITFTFMYRVLYSYQNRRKKHLQKQLQKQLDKQRDDTNKTGGL